MSVAILRDRPGGWFTPGARKGSEQVRRSGPDTGVRHATKPARNVAGRGAVRTGSSLVALVIFLVRVAGWVLGVIMLIGLLGGVSLGLIYGYRTLTTSTHFAVSHVDVAGARQLSSPEIVNLSGIAVGMNILEVSLGEMSRKLQNNPWIENVSVRRVLPDTVTIDVVEREPFFWIQQAGTLYYADRSGSPIAPLELGRFVSLPTLIIDQDAQPNWRILGEWAQAVERREFPFGFPEVAWLKVEDANIVRIHLEEQGLTIHFDIKEWRQNREIINSVWEDLRVRGELDNAAMLTVMSGKAWVQAKQP